MRRLIAVVVVALFGISAAVAAQTNEIPQPDLVCDEFVGSVIDGRVALSCVDTAPETTAPETTAPETTAPAAVFVETFTGNTGRDRFVTGVFHRDDTVIKNATWTGDHDLACGTPDTQRTIHRDSPDESFYVCRDHWMSSVGDTSGYSIGWFAPDANGDGQADVFSAADIDRVAWDVNVTDLGARQWWEVVIVPVGAPFLTTVDWVAAVAGIDGYHPETVAVGKGPFGNDGNITAAGVTHDPLGWAHVCDGTDWEADPEGCDSKMIRRPFSVTDNRDGTISVEFLGDTYTYPGEFPDEFRVIFKDHNYTPDKDGTPVGHTWHWDNITID